MARERRRRRPQDEEELQHDELPATPPGLASVAAVQRAQRLVGNHAVAGLLARDANPALERPPTARTPKPKLRSGREVDAIFDASPYLKDMVGTRLRKVTLAKAMRLDDDAAFEAAWIEYAMRSYNPETNANYTEAEARRYLVTKGVRAFQDEDHGEVHIRRSSADLGTQLHEGLHLFSADRWKKRMNYHANEGVTEFFTRKIGPEVQVERDDSSFLQQFTSATHLVRAADEQTVAAAYFEGDLAGLAAKLEPRGAGTWRKWLGFMEAGDFKAANKLMQ